MDYDIIEVIPIIKTGTNTLRHNEQFKANDVTKHYGSASTVTQQKIYTHQDLQLIINNTTTLCYKVEYIESNLVGKVVYVKRHYTNIPLEHFPFITKYDNIITKNIYEYADINYIEEGDISFFEVKNDDQLKKLIGYIS